MPRSLRLLLLPFVALTLVLTSTTVPAHAAGTDTWVKWNLGDVWIRSLDYVGSDLIAGSETSGVFRASSAAGPWTNVSSNLSTLGKQVRQAVGQSGSVYLATSAGLFKGNGTGGSWTQIGNDDSTPSYQRLNQGGVQTVRFPTGSASYLVVGTSGSGRDGIFYSSDSGAHWTKAGGFTGGAYYMVSSGTTMYVAGSTGFWKSTDSGKNWTLRSDGIPSGETAKRIAINPVNSNYLIAATVGGVYRSDNAGASWYDASGSGAGLLNASEVRAFQLVPSIYWNGAIPRIVVGTNNGVWATSDGGLNWAKMSPDKNVPEVSMGSESVYALNIGFGTPGSLIAGTQGHGIFTLPLQAAIAPGTIPAPSGTPVENNVLTANTGTWSGTLPFGFGFQWKRCSNNSGTSDATCPDISGATGKTYQLTSTDVGDYIRVEVTARSLVQENFGGAKLSEPTGVVTSPPGSTPTPPGVYPNLSNANSAPWGLTMTIDESDVTPEQWKAGINYAPTTFQYRWYRCSSVGTNCALMSHTGRSYTTTTVDVDHQIHAYVIGEINGVYSDERLAGQSGVIYEQTPVPVAAPKVIGRPFVGQVLGSTAGAWTGNGPSYARRWFRCNAQGLQCNPTSPVVTTPSYVVQPGDKGYTFKIEIKASVTDLNATRTGTAYSAQTPVIGAALPSCATVVPALAAAVAAVVNATKAVKAKKKALKKAKKSGKKAKIKKAKKKLKAAQNNLKTAIAKKNALQALSTTAAC